MCEHDARSQFVFRAPAGEGLCQLAAVQLLGEACTCSLQVEGWHLLSACSHGHVCVTPLPENMVLTFQDLPQRPVTKHSTGYMGLEELPSRPATGTGFAATQALGFADIVNAPGTSHPVHALFVGDLIYTILYIYIYISINAA